MKKDKNVQNKEKRAYSGLLFFLCSFLPFILFACKLGGPVELPLYTIVYNANGGDGVMGNSDLVYGASRNLNANGFTREGYRFTGWADAPGGAVKYADGQSVANLTKNDGEVITLYAVWAPNSYTVVYDKNGGEGTMESTAFTYGVPQNLRANAFTRADYVFTGWAMEKNGEAAFTDGASVSNLTTVGGGTVTLYAQWGVNVYTVAYNPNGGNGNMQASQFTLGVSYNLPANTFTRAGYTFAGWARTEDGAVAFADGASVTNLTTAGATVNLYAQWQGVSYTVAYDKNGGEGSMEDSAFIYGTVQNLRKNIFTRANYAFIGWAKAATGTVEFADEESVTDLAATADATVTLYAQWTPAYAVNFNADNGSPAPAQQMIVSGGTVDEPAAMSKTGYTFDAWYREAAFTNKWNFASDAVTADITLYAKWNINQYAVAFNADGGTPAPASPVTVNHGDTVTEPAAMTKTGHDFDGWYRDSNFAARWDFANDAVTGSVTLYAKWNPHQYAAAFNADGGTPAPASPITVYHGQKITAPAAMSKAGHAFDGWYTEAAFANQWNFANDIVTGNLTLYAKWLLVYTVTFNADGGNPAPVQQTVASGGKVTEPADMNKAGYVFDGWYREAAFTNEWNFASDTVTDNITLYAKWEESIFSMVWVPGGSFQMGTVSGGGTNERPVHTVTLTGFYMGRTEVTQSQYQEVTGSLPSSLTTGTNYGRGDNYPVYYVSWYDSLVFCNKLSMREGLTPAYRISGSTDPTAWGSVPTSSNSAWNAAEIVSGSTGYRLPTEAQWEYAAKGGNGSPGNYTYAGSNTVGDVAWYSGNSGSTSHEVGTKAPNGLGLYDMSGNVWEWCWDWSGSYSSTAQTDPTGASSGSYRVIRGGNWHDSAASARSAYRNGLYPYARNHDVGFRLARPAQ